MVVQLPAGAVPSADADMSDHAAEIAELRERLARMEGEGTASGQIISELRTALEWHRRPWWKRLFG